MSTDAMGYVLGLITLGMSMVAVKYRNMLLTLGTAALWVTLLNYMITNNTAGSDWLELFVIAAYTFIALFALIFLVNRREAVGSWLRRGSGEEEEEEVENTPARGRQRGLMNYSTDEYRALVRSKVRPPKRRR